MNLKKLSFSQIWFFIGLIVYLVALVQAIGSLQNFIFSTLLILLSFNFLFHNFGRAREFIKLSGIEETNEADKKWV